MSLPTTSTTTTSNLLDVAQTGTQLVSSTTQYLSTLPHPIEIVEELIAVVSVTCSLLSTLHITIHRFPALKLSPTTSFLVPLQADLRFAFTSLKNVIRDAVDRKVFQPNDVGLVRIPRNAWALVCGGEGKAGVLRSRLYVEKYRVRVLIDAVSWVGLRGLAMGRSLEEDGELGALTRMLPLVAERLVGVQRDYVPRLMGKSVVEEVKAEEKDEKVVEVKVNQIQEAAKVQPKPVFDAPAPIITKIQPSIEFNMPKLNRKLSSSSTSSWESSSTSSSTTQIDTSITELYILRCNEATPTLVTKRTICAIPITQKTTLKPCNYYIKPLASTPLEIQLQIQLSYLNHRTATSEPVQHTQRFKKAILKLDEPAQWEIQKLLETREAASSSATGKSSWEVIAFVERQRRKISSADVKSKWWKRSEEKNERREWVLVVRGEMGMGGGTSITPDKNGDPWARKVETLASALKKEMPVPVREIHPQLQPQTQLSSPQQQLQQGTLQSQPQPQAQVAPVLRHVETRKGLSAQEAEEKMLEIVGEIFGLEKDREELIID